MISPVIDSGLRIKRCSARRRLVDEERDQRDRIGLVGQEPDRYGKLACAECEARTLAGDRVRHVDLDRRVAQQSEHTGKVESQFRKAFAAQRVFCTAYEYVVDGALRFERLTVEVRDLVAAGVLRAHDRVVHADRDRLGQGLRRRQELRCQRIEVARRGLVDEQRDQRSS